MGMTGLYYILKYRDKITADSSDSNVQIQNKWTKITYQNAHSNK